MRAPIPPNETERLAAVKRHCILGTPPEAALDRITALAARLFSVPISLLTLVDETRQWFKSVYGLDIRETPREIAFCAHAIASDGVMVVNNAAQDARFHDNPLVRGAPNIRFYAGAPLTTADGFHLGTLCIIDRAPRELTPEQQILLQHLAATAMDELELRLAIITASRRQEDHAEMQRLAPRSERSQPSEDILQKVLEALPVGVWIADKEGNLLHGNAAGRAIWGGSALVPIKRYDEYVGWWAETGERIRAEDWAMARAIRRGETSIGKVVRIQAFDGSEKIVLNSAVPLHGPSGEIAGAIVLNEDIPERRRAEEALRQTKDELEGLIYASPLAVICFDRGGRVIRWNPAAERMFGWLANEVIGEFYHIIVPENLQAEYQELCQRMFRGESFQDFETLRMRKDGTVMNVSISAAALHGPSGEITGIVALLADTTARKVADTALRDSEERYRTLVELSPNAISVHDGEKVLFVNPAAARMAGARKASEIVGRNPLEFLHPDFHASFRERTRQVIEDGTATPLLELKLRRLDGSEIDAEVISLPYRYDGHPAVQVVMRDITDRKRAEAEAHEQERSLAAMAENLPAFLAIKDRDLRYVIANRLFCNAVGCPPEQIAGKTDFDLFDAEHAAKYRADDEAVLHTGEKLYVEEAALLPNSAIRDVGTIRAPLRTDNGEVTGLVAMAFDLTERNRLEAELRVSEERFRRAITDAPVPIMIHSSDGRILQINDALSKLSGYRPEDLSTMQDWISNARAGAGGSVE